MRRKTKSLAEYLRPIRLKKRLIVLMLALGATGCASTVNDYCELSSIIVPSEQDVNVMSDFLVKQLLTHNEIYAKLCDVDK